MKTRCIGAFLPIKLLSSHSVQGSNFSLTDSFLHTTSCTRLPAHGKDKAIYMPPPVLPLLASSCIPEKPQDANSEFPHAHRSSKGCHRSTADCHALPLQGKGWEHDRKNVPGIRSPPAIEIHASRQTGRNQKAFSTVSPHSSSTLMSNPQGLSVEKKLPL